jgi:predicted O-linked N-acetylglucosamine transferase (SPINDLY family)
MSTTFKSCRKSTESNPAALSIATTAAASLAGFFSRFTFLYAELPITSATRFSACAATAVAAKTATAKKNERKKAISPAIDGRIRLGYIEATLLDSAIPSFHNDEPTDRA